MMALTILKDGKPAGDVGLYLGVPAHAVFVSMDDLNYVHAHAMGGWRFERQPRLKRVA
ncbi:hypothetical protein LMG3431_01441 [Achromobacter pestifer]|uniref:Uncharacterized protein n=2 Tax=Achromobacter pestifer TaxID=1353889 RepID=A0A6S6YPG7_9BURK|nr:hypothetical protein LMG3431_01441 [Achromobacter pestifer]